MSSCAYFQLLPTHQLEGIYRDIQKSDNAPSLVDDVRNLVEWLKTQPHLSHIEISQSYVMSILLLEKGFEKAKRHLEFHYTCRAIHPEYFIDWDPCATRFQNMYNSLYIFPSKVLPSDGNMIWFIGRGTLHDGSSLTVQDLGRAITMIGAHQRSFSPIRATIYVMDCKHVTSHLIQLFIAAIPKVFPLVMKLNATRFHKIYLLHQFPMLAAIISLVKNIPVFNKKLGDRVEIWNRNVDELVSVLPAECLPCDYGGSCPSINEQKDEYYKCISQQRDWFMNECQKKTRLDLRPKITDDEDDDLFGFGVDGTFRQLSVD